MSNSSGRHVESIMASVPCGRHQAGIGEPCFWSNANTPGRIVIGLCNKRIKKAGFNGKISHTSYQQKKSTPSNRKR